MFVIVLTFCIFHLTKTQDSVWNAIGIARILSAGGALFSSKKLTTFFSHRSQNTG